MKLNLTSLLMSMIMNIYRLKLFINMETLDKIDIIWGHIQQVQKNCFKLGKKLINNGDCELGLSLISNGQIHDNSKFHGFEFKHLHPGDPLLEEAVRHHAETNSHHPEHWNSIHDMPDVFLAEMVCDCSARASEFGTDVRLWFKERATNKYNFTFEDEIGKKILYFLDLLLDKPF